MLRYVLICSLICGSFITSFNSLSAADKAGVQAVTEDSTTRIMIGGEHFATYNYGKDLPKPFLYPINAPGKNPGEEELVVRKINWDVKATDKRKDYDHVHHKGLWTSIDEVNGIKFWMEGSKIINQSVKVTQAEDNSTVSLDVVNNWVDLESKPVIEESTHITFYPNRSVDYAITLKAMADVVEFGDTKEGFFAVRMPDDLREEKSTGVITNALGDRTEKECWGKEAPWVDYTGTRNGEQIGIAMFDDPHNFRKSRYHVRAYGLFAINPLGAKSYTEKSESPQPAAPVILKKGETVSMRYGVYVHKGDADAAKVNEVYEQFTHRAMK
jgi:hypothetical protein